MKGRDTRGYPYRGYPPATREPRALLSSNGAWVFFTSRRIVNNEELWDGAYGLSSMSEENKKSNHVQT